MPYAVPFIERMRIFEHLVRADRLVHQPPNGPGVPVHVRRGRVLEDGLAALERAGGAGMKKRLCVIYMNDAGAQEAGIDMGGLYKDFHTDLSAMAFDMSYGLFATTADGLMFPNPQSRAVHGPETHLRLFEFLGRVLGKALYEGITIQPQFATFFLGFMRGKCNYMTLFNDLAGLDEELYRNLVFLKSYDGAGVEDLGLTFTVTEDNFGANTEVELVPGGANVGVTSSNRLEYV
ncbi:unnamed protein product, partial [Phaeothamnion confervicola]